MGKLCEMKFPHRKNPDGSWDSICTKCFRTVATAEAEGELVEAEAAHVCPPSIFTNAQSFEKTQKKTA